MLLVLCFLLGFMLNLAVDGGTMPHKQVIGTAVTPLFHAFSWCRNKVTHFFDALTRYDDLEAENTQLKQKVAELQKEVGDAYYDKIQNERLKELLSMTENSYSFEFVSADVVSISSGGWDSSFSINAGARAGIRKGAVVVSEFGLVGKVTDAGSNWATVSAFTDPQISVGATIVSTGESGVTEGTLALKTKGMCLVSYLNRDSTVNRGDLICTSGLGGRYPAGIPLGTVEEIRYENNGLTLSVVLKPSTDFSSLKQVFVITNFSEDES